MKTTDSALTPAKLAARIDHTILKPQATPAEILKLCDEAREHGFAAVCLNPVFVPLAARRLEGSPVHVCTVAGFPLGAMAAELKVAEARRAVAEGAREVDMVLWVGGLKAGQDEAVRADIAAVAEACHAGRALLKVILEACLLTEAEKIRACELCIQAKADFVKTSTGFSTGGATIEDVALMARTAGAVGLGVKAAGGIRTLADALAMLRAGATRIGSSGSVAILKEAAGALAG